MLKKILIVQPYGIGDLLFLTPIFRVLRKTVGVQTMDLLLGSRTEAVVAGNPHIDEIFSIDKDAWRAQGKRKMFSDIKALTSRFRKKKYDLLLDYSLRGEYGFWAQFFLGIPKRAGFDYKRRGFFHNIKRPIPDGFSGRHVVEFCADLARFAGIPVENLSMDFYPSAEDRGQAQELLQTSGISGRFLCLSAGGGESWGKDAHFKRWPPRHFAELTEMLKAKHGFSATVILGSRGEVELARELSEQVSGSVLNLCGKISLGTSAALLEKSSLFIGNDGGLMHLAHALKCPVIAMFGPVDPLVYGPFPPGPSAAAIVKKKLDCRPCYFKFRYNSACEHRKCLQELSPDEVLKNLAEQKFNFDACSPKA